MKIPVDEAPAGATLDAAIEMQLDRPGCFYDYVHINGKRHDVRTWIPDGFTPEDPPAGQTAGRMPRPYSTEPMMAWLLPDWVLSNLNYDSCTMYVKFDYAQFRFHAVKWGKDSKWPPVPSGETYTIIGEAKSDYSLDQSGITVLPLAICRAFLKVNDVTEIEVPDDA